MRVYLRQNDSGDYTAHTLEEMEDLTSDPGEWYEVDAETFERWRQATIDFARASGEMFNMRIHGHEIRKGR
jgi:hypothetical protein